MTPLQRLIETEISTTGPMTVSRFMHLCLAHPQHGYYATGNPLGAAGDFITAPEISQLFGELIGAWLIDTWIALGRPSPFVLAELGPGRGTLMADIWRVAKNHDGFAAAVAVHLVETSPALRDVQAATLDSVGLVATFHENLSTLPQQPALWIGNEFFDALPTNQWVCADKGWHARKIGLAPEGGFSFGVDRTPQPAPKNVQAAHTGAIIEHSPLQDTVFGSVCRHLKDFSGAALFIDYGALLSGTGDTLQAVRDHKKTDPLVDPGASDLTTHVDFAHFARLAEHNGLPSILAAHQGAFLLDLGLLERAGQLGAEANDDQREAISAAVERLAGDAGMGRLFKVMGLASKPLPLSGLHPFPPDESAHRDA